MMISETQLPPIRTTKTMEIHYVARAFSTTTTMPDQVKRNYMEMVIIAIEPVNALTLGEGGS